jgi:hypothetical protein
VTKYLNDFKFGVEISGGAKVVLHSANRVLSQRHEEGFLAMLTIEFSNVFIMIDIVTRGEGMMSIYFFVGRVSLWSGSEVVPWGRTYYGSHWSART